MKAMFTVKSFAMEFILLPEALECMQNAKELIEL
jgi:hypothetical protein